MKRGTLDVSAVRFFVLDEADRLVDQEGLKVVEQLFQGLPKGGAGTSRLQVSSHSSPRQLCTCSCWTRQAGWWTRMASKWWSGRSRACPGAVPAPRACR